MFQVIHPPQKITLACIECLCFFYVFLLYFQLLIFSTPYKFTRLIVKVKRDWLCIQSNYHPIISAETSYLVNDISEICAQIYTLHKQENKCILPDNNFQGQGNKQHLVEDNMNTPKDSSMDNTCQTFCTSLHQGILYMLYDLMMVCPAI